MPRPPAETEFDPGLSLLAFPPYPGVLPGVGLAERQRAHAHPW